MGYFRKKPVTIQAVQWTGQNLFEVTAFMSAGPQLKHDTAVQAWETYSAIVARDGLEIRTLEDGVDGRARHIASNGDWIIRGVQGEFYPCKPDIFIATYDPVVTQLPLDMLAQ